MSIEIKDRVALKPDWFILEEVENAGHPQGKKVYSIIPYNFVVEEGTPINKGLLQPLVDSLDAVDISADFGTKPTNAGYVEYEVTAFRVGKVVTGIALFHFDADIYKGEQDGGLLDIKEQYQPICGAVGASNSYGAVGDNIVVPLVSVVGSGVTVEFSTYVSTVVVSFTYICKGESNGNS